jgi:predicted nucleic acid-binding protein
MIVVDTMNLGYLLLNHPAFSEDVREMARVDDEWCAPPLWRSELRNTFMQHVRASGDPNIPGADLTLSGPVERMSAAEALIAERTLDVRSEPVLRFAHESGCTAYDCEYVALAQRLDVPLITYDEPVLDAFPDTALRPSEFLSMHGN